MFCGLFFQTMQKMGQLLVRSDSEGVVGKRKTVNCFAPDQESRGKHRVDRSSEQAVHEKRRKGNLVVISECRGWPVVDTLENPRRNALSPTLDISAFGRQIMVNPEAGVGKHRLVSDDRQVSFAVGQNQPVPFDQMMPQRITGIVPVKSFFQESREDRVPDGF